MRKKKSLTIEEELIKWVAKRAKEHHTNFSNELNNILWKVKDAKSKN